MIRFTLLVLACLLAAAPAVAWNGVQVYEAEGDLQQHYWVAPTPTPGYCYWDHPTSAGPVFTASHGDGSGNMGCPDPWFVHCDGDSLVFRGAWPMIDDPQVTGIEYAVDLICAVDVAAATRIRAVCTVTAGPLDTAEHSLTITHPDGTNEVLLEGGVGDCRLTRTLPPGDHLVRLRVRAYEHKSYDEVVDAYAGALSLYWEDPATVAVEPVSWSSLKAAFRR
ncbi:MAG: hypothetical protein GY838_00300 [bacterium]|nr:hypothetical protein [bacterium]